MTLGVCIYLSAGIFFAVNDTFHAIKAKRHNKKVRKTKRTVRKTYERCYSE
jgi:hypothetical protein